jgi:hypothetical protein
MHVLLILLERLNDTQQFSIFQFTVENKACRSGRMILSCHVARVREMESVSIFCNRNPERRGELGKFTCSVSSSCNVHRSNICSGNSSNGSCSSTVNSIGRCSSGNGAGHSGRTV